MTLFAFITLIIKSSISMNFQLDEDRFISLKLLVKDFYSDQCTNVLFIHEDTLSYSIPDILKSDSAIKFSVNIADFIQIEKSNYFVKQRFSCAIVSVDFGSLLKLVNNWKLEIDGYYTFVLDESSSFHIMSVFKLCWKQFIYNVNVLVKAHNSSKAFLYTFMPFKDNFCHDTNPVKINEFDNFNLKWTTNVYFPQKFKNLHKCLVNLGIIESAPAVVIKKINSSIILYGFESEILKEVERKTNFTMNITIDKELPKLYENGSSSGLFYRIIHGDVDLAFSFLALNQIRINVMSAIYPHMNDKIIVVTSSNIPVGSMMKLLLPFKPIVWLLLLFVVLSAASVVYVSKFRTTLKNVFGPESSIMNLLVIMLGLTQSKLPKKNFPRILMMTSLLFCLVLRSGYSGELFRLLHSNPGKLVSTIEDLKINHFELFVWPDLQYVTFKFGHYER